MFTVDFKGIQGLVSAGITRGFEERKRAVVKVPMEDTGIVNADLLLLSGVSMNALLDKCFRHRRNIHNRTVKPHGCVNAMSEEIACYSGTGGIYIETPRPGTPLWKVRTDGPVLEKICAVVKDLAKLP